MNKKKVLILGLMMILLMVALSGCVPGDGANSQAKLAGFFTGVWHGWIAPFSLIYSIFNRGIRIYEVFNTGILYDLGYYMAIISGFGGLTMSRKNQKNKNKNKNNPREQ